LIFKVGQLGEDGLEERDEERNVIWSTRNERTEKVEFSGMKERYSGMNRFLAEIHRWNLPSGGKQLFRVQFKLFSEFHQVSLQAAVRRLQIDSKRSYIQTR